jgi:hypothetical protein
MNRLKEIWLNIVNTANSKGIPIPVLRDPKTGTGSISSTMTVISFNLVLLGIIGKWGAGLDINLQEALNLFFGSCAIYFGRGLQTSGKDVKMEAEKKDQNS